MVPQAATAVVCPPTRPLFWRWHRAASPPPFPRPPPPGVIQGVWERVQLSGGSPDDQWVDVTYVGELEGVCCASRSGLLVQVDAVTLGVQVVGDMPAGVVALAWSPDQGMVAILTGARTLVCMTPSWQVRGRRPASATGCVEKRVRPLCLLLCAVRAARAVQVGGGQG
jgi:hypothetical protein